MSCCHGDRRPATPVQNLVTGGLLVIAGLLLLAYGRGWIVLEQPWAWWPLVFVGIGIQRLAAPPPHRSVVAALIWAGVGAVIIAANHGLVSVRARDVVPVILVLLGIRMLMVRRREGTS